MLIFHTNSESGVVTLSIIVSSFKRHWHAMPNITYVPQKNSF